MSKCSTCNQDAKYLVENADEDKGNLCCEDCKVMWWGAEFVELVDD